MLALLSLTSKARFTELQTEPQLQGLETSRLTGVTHL